MKYTFDFLRDEMERWWQIIGEAKKYTFDELQKMLNQLLYIHVNTEFKNKEELDKATNWVEAILIDWGKKSFHLLTLCKPE